MYNEYHTFACPFVLFREEIDSLTYL